MQTVQFYLLLKPRVPSSGLGSREDKVISTFPSRHSLLFTVVPCFGSRKRSREILWQIVSEAYSSNTPYAEQGHRKGNMLESEEDRKNHQCQGKGGSKCNGRDSMVSGFFFFFFKVSFLSKRKIF